MTARADSLWDEYDKLIPGLPVPGLIRVDTDKKLDRKIQATLRRVRAEMIAEYERNKAAAAAAAAPAETGEGHATTP